MQCQKLTHQSIKSITHFFLLIYLTFLHLSYALCLFWLHVTTEKKTQFLRYCLLNGRWGKRGGLQTKGKRNTGNLPPRWGFKFHIYLFQKTKEERKVSCFICQSADIFNIISPPNAQINQVGATGLANVSKAAVARLITPSKQPCWGSSRVAPFSCHG